MTDTGHSQLQVLPRLKEKISIERARMRLKSVLPKGLPGEAVASLRDMLNAREAKIESEDTSGSQVSSSNLQDFMSKYSFWTSQRLLH